MQRLRLNLSRPFVLLISLIHKNWFKKSSSQQEENHLNSKENSKMAMEADINTAIINAWYAPSTSAQIYYYDSDCIKITPITFPNISTN